jgi:hypothetical protein
MKRLVFPLAAGLAVAVLVQPPARAVGSPPLHAGAVHGPSAAVDARDGGVIEFALSPGWASVTGADVDRRGNLVIVGHVASDRFPVTADAADGSCRPGKVALQVWSRDGQLLYSTCLGGERIRSIEGPAVASAGDGSLWVVSGTSQPGEYRFDTRLWRLPPGSAGCDEVFVAGPLGSCSIAAGREASVWLACQDSVGHLSTVNAWQPTYAGNGDVVIARFEPGRPELALLTYLGGPDADAPRALAVAPDGDLVVAGWSSGPGFPLVRPFQVWTGDEQNFFVARLDESGRWLEFSSRFAVQVLAPVAQVVVDRAGSTFVLGMAPDMVPPSGGQAAWRPPSQDVFLLELDRAGVLRQAATIEPAFQTRVAPEESLYLHHAAARADGSLLIARTFNHFDSARSRPYGGGAVVSFVDRAGRAVRGVEIVELESGGAWIPTVVASGPRELFVAGQAWDLPGTRIVARRVDIGRVRGDDAPRAISDGKR